MLTTLRIKNLALVADLAFELAPGFNVVTGETGAGKSVILGALNLVLGQRADRTLLRAGADTCTVEACFDVRQLRAPFADFLAENGLEPCEEHQLVLKRSFSAAGTNRQFINGSATSLGVLAQLGGWLVDMHGPHDHQSLLQPARQLHLLDAFGALAAPRQRWADLVRERGELLAARQALVMDERTYAQQLDLLRFQVQEIKTARLQPGEDETIAAEHAKAGNAARLIELSRAALGLLQEDDQAVLNQGAGVGRALQELVRLDPAAVDLTATHGQAMELLRDLATSLERYADRIELDPARLAELEERLNLLQSLKRKYGPQLADVIAFGESAAERLATLESLDSERTRLAAAIAAKDRELRAAGTALSAARHKLLARFTRAVTRELAVLGFAQAQLAVELSTEPALAGKDPLPDHLPLTGLDTADFQFAPNPGEPARPLRAIASSGELARVMLALKTVLAAEDEVPVLVFDEVDANVGGETARAVGRKLRDIARQHQVICITHLAPVAAEGDAHYVVSKATQDGRTETRLQKLDHAGRVTEITRMLGGTGAAARQHAEALLGGGA